MKSPNEYHTELIELLENFDELSQKDLKNTYQQSINDLNLEESSYDIIISTIGTPEEFLAEYMKEMDESKTIDMMENADKRLSNSYKWMGLIQLIAILMPFSIASAPNRGIHSDIIGLIFLSYALMVVIAVSFYYLSQNPFLSRNSIANTYYNGFKALIILVVANLITDDYVLEDINIYIDGNYEYYPLGFLIIWQIPVAIISGFELRVIRSKSQLAYNKHEIFESKFMYEFKKIMYILLFVIIYVFEDIYFLIAGIIIMTLVIIIEGFINRRNNLNFPSGIAKDIVVVNILFTLLWLTIDNLFGGWI